MKKFGLLVLGLCFSFAVMSQAVIEFETMEHNFGRIYEQDGNVTYVFVFTNVGDSVLLVTNARTGCGCATPVWTRTPVEPGESGTVSVTYNPRGRVGTFARPATITINNTANPTTRLMLRGEVIRREE